MSQELYQAFMVIINFAALVVAIIALVKKQQLKKAIQWLGRLLSNSKNYERAISLPRMSAVSFYAHYTTENGKDKFEMIPFSVSFIFLNDKSAVSIHTASRHVSGAFFTFRMTVRLEV